MRKDVGESEGVNGGGLEYMKSNVHRIRHDQESDDNKA